MLKKCVDFLPHSSRSCLVFTEQRRDSSVWVLLQTSNLICDERECYIWQIFGVRTGVASPWKYITGCRRSQSTNLSAGLLWRIVGSRYYALANRLSRSASGCQGIVDGNWVLVSTSPQSPTSSQYPYDTSNFDLSPFSVMKPQSSFEHYVRNTNNIMDTWLCLAKVVELPPSRHHLLGRITEHAASSSDRPSWLGHSAFSRPHPTTAP